MAVPEITDVDVRILRAVPDEPIAMSFGSMSHRSMALVSVTASDGTVGYGESWINYPSWAGAERRATIEDGVAPLLVGRPADDVPALHELMLDRLMPLGRQWGAPGPICQAISGVDIALWDRHARAQGRPLAMMLTGGELRSSAPVYASSLGPSDVATQAAWCRSQGFKLVKLKVGFGRDVDEQNLATAREVLGNDIDLAVDANQRWTLTEALAHAPLLAAAHVAWIEEPIAGNSLPELEEFYRRTGLPVATGENLYLAPAFEPYLASPAVQILQPDVTKSGGVTELVTVCARATDVGKPVMPHFYGGVIGFAATLQLAAALPAITAVEYDVRSNPLRDPLMKAPPRQVGGMLTLPLRPGLGIDLDFAAVAGFAESSAKS